MDKIKRFIDVAVPVLTCNLRCEYCYITQNRKFLNALPLFTHDAKYIGRALSVERLGGICHLNLCGGGETLLPPEMPEIIHEIIKQGHYIAVVTNGTITKRFEEICELPKPILEKLLFKFSFHYTELKRLNMFDTFFSNIDRVKNAGCSFSVELTPNDETMEYIDDIKQICLERLGALCHITVARDETKEGLPILTSHKKEDYIEKWGSFNSPLFDFKLSTFNVKRREFCYAGEWTAYLNLGTGILRQCYSGNHIQNIYSDLTKPIKFSAVGKNCNDPHCHNSHVWMTLGVIPSIDNIPTYADMRNRKCSDGTEWLNPQMKEFLGQKLYENNTEYDEKKKQIVNRKMFFMSKVNKISLEGARLIKKHTPKKVKIEFGKYVRKHQKKYEGEEGKA